MFFGCKDDINIKVYEMEKLGMNLMEPGDRLAQPVKQLLEAEGGEGRRTAKLQHDFRYYQGGTRSNFSKIINARLFLATSAPARPARHAGRPPSLLLQRSLGPR